MKVLIAEDNALNRRLLESTLCGAGYEVLSAHDGSQALELLRQPDAPSMLILDWIMPGADGIEVCRQARRSERSLAHYIILLTSRAEKHHVVAGLEAGADDYISKPFDEKELLARVQVGFRVLALQRELTDRATALEEALSRVKTLEGLIPICCYCKKIRNDKDYWQELELYVEQRSEARFSHGICPRCYRKVVQPQLERPARRS